MTHRRSIKIPESFMWFNHTGEIAKPLSPLEKEGQNWTEQELLTENKTYWRNKVIIHQENTILNANHTGEVICVIRLTGVKF